MSWAGFGSGITSITDYIFINHKAILTIGTFVVFWISVVKKVYYVNSSDDVPAIDINWVILLATLLGLHIAEGISARIQSGKTDRNNLATPSLAPSTNP